MHVRRTILSASLAVLVAVTASAQQSTGNVTQVIRQKAAPGMAGKYEAGRKKHMDWHRKMADPWGWGVGQITTGPDTGSYIIVTGNHEWQAVTFTPDTLVLYASRNASHDGPG